jgi:hypothetical protein
MAKPAEADVGASLGYGDLLTRIPTIDDVLNATRWRYVTISSGIGTTCIGS